MSKLPSHQTIVVAVLVATTAVQAQAQQPHARQSHAQQGILRKESDYQTDRIRDRLWIWGHPAGVYNDSYLAPLGKQSSGLGSGLCKWEMKHWSKRRVSR